MTVLTRHNGTMASAPTVPPVSLEGLPTRWVARAEELAPYAPAAAEAFRTAATELRDHLASAEDSVTLKEAHAIGGYSIDHLQRLVSDGTIDNVGRKGRPRIRRRDVPVRPGHAVLRLGARPPQLSRSAVVTSAIKGAAR